MKTLRPYQKAAETSLLRYLFDYEGHPLVVAPVAAGKSLMIANFIKRIHEFYPRTRIVKLTHVKELLQQNAQELLEQYPDVDMGFYCAGLNQKKLHNDVTFASIQSIYNKLHLFNRPPEIIIIDEAHLISHKADTTYRKFIDACLAINPNCRVVGFTGTPYRSDTGRLDVGHNRLFDYVCYEIGMDYMIEQGYWSKPVCPDVSIKMDVSGVSIRGGDYVEKQLQEAVNQDHITGPCVDELINLGEKRKKWLIFTAGIDHAERVAEKLDERGISTVVVHSGMTKNENDVALMQHKAGKIRALVNVAKLTTGYNDPEIDLICFMRPTRSPVLYVQMIGRGVRVCYASGHDISTQQGRLDAIASGIKPDCMVVDFGGVVSTLGPIDQISIEKEYVPEEEKDKKENEGSEPIIKICPSCNSEWPHHQKYCLSCGHCFIKLTTTAGKDAVVSTDSEPEWVDVMAMRQSKHQTPDSWQPSMCVAYSTMLGNIRQWICFEHWKADVGEKKRYAWDMAVKWHNERLPQVPVPKDALDASLIDYPQPSKILVKKEGKYFKVLDYEWSEDKFDYAKGQIRSGEFVEDEEDFEIPF